MQSIPCPHRYADGGGSSTSLKRKAAHKGARKIEMSEGSHVMNLPVELWITILCHLSAQDVARIQQVSQYFNRMVQATPEIQWAAESSLAGVEDCPGDNPRSASDRLTSLEQWRKSWRSAEWCAERVFPLPTLSEERHCRLECFSGPLHARAPPQNPGTSICFNIYGSPTRSLQPSNWTIDNLQEHDVFGCDFYQDLLVLVESQLGSQEVKLHFLTCSNGVSHPGASRKSMNVPLPPVALPIPLLTFQVVVTGSILKLVLQWDDGELFREILVCDWKQGQLLVHIGSALQRPDYDIVDLVFLDSRYAVLASNSRFDIEVTPDRRNRLVVIDCSNMPSYRLSIADVIDNYSILELELPPTVERAVCGITELQYAPPCASPLDPQLRGPVFRTTTLSPVLAIGLFIALWDGVLDEDEFQFDLLVPARAVHTWLADAVAARARGGRAAPVPWRTLVRASRLLDVTRSRDSAVWGARHASTGFTKVRGEAGAHDNRQVVVLHHFDAPHAIARDLAREPRLGRGSRRIPRQACLTEPETIVDEQVWAEPMEMGAWARQVWTDIPVEAGEEIVLFEDGLAIRSPEKQQLTVYTI